VSDGTDVGTTPARRTSCPGGPGLQPLGPWPTRSGPPCSSFRPNDGNPRRRAVEDRRHSPGDRPWSRTSTPGAGSSLSLRLRRSSSPRPRPLGGPAPLSPPTTGPHRHRAGGRANGTGPGTGLLGRPRAGRRRRQPPTRSTFVGRGNVWSFSRPNDPVHGLEPVGEPTGHPPAARAGRVKDINPGHRQLRTLGSWTGPSAARVFSPPATGRRHGRELWKERRHRRRHGDGQGRQHRAPATSAYIFHSHGG